MKKKISALILTAMLTLSVVGCSGDTATTTATTTTAITTTTADTTTAVISEDVTASEDTAETTAETAETSTETSETTEAITSETYPESSVISVSEPQTQETVNDPSLTTAPITTAETTTAKTIAATTSPTQDITVAEVPKSVTDIVSKMGAGWNLGNTLEANISGTPSETAWGNPKATKELIDAVKAAGFNTVRIPVSYLSKIGDDYTVDSAWLDRISEVVGYVIDNDMYAIVNMHGDGYYTINGGWLLCAEDDSKQTEIKAKYESVWKQIAEKLKKYDDHLIFESMNEEFNNQYGSIDAKAYSNINDYNQIFVDTVRATGGNNKNRWLLVPGWNTDINSTNAASGFVIPTDSAKGRLMISVHYYDPYNFTINSETTVYKWGNNAVKPQKVSWGHEDHLENQFKKVYNEFTSKGYPVVIGEYGAMDKTYVSQDSTEYRRYFDECVANAATRYGCVPVVWDNGYNGKNGLALFDRKTCEQIYPTIIEGIIRGVSGSSYTIKEPVTTE